MTKKIFLTLILFTSISNTITLHPAQQPSGRIKKILHNIENLIATIEYQDKREKQSSLLCAAIDNEIQERSLEQEYTIIQAVKFWHQRFIKFPDATIFLTAHEYLSKRKEGTTQGGMEQKVLKNLTNGFNNYVNFANFTLTCLKYDVEIKLS